MIREGRETYLYKRCWNQPKKGGWDGLRAAGRKQAQATKATTTERGGVKKTKI